MNVIVVLIDSLNRHNLAAYGESPIATPNIDAFARKAWRFDNHFVGSLPCMPARREIFAGVREMMWRPWGPLEPFDARMPRLLEMEGGYTTAIITDHYHYWEEPGNGYLQSFLSAEMVRGHELDNWKSPVPPDAPVPGWVSSMEAWLPKVATRRYYANVKDFKTEEDFFPSKVMRGGAAWLREYARSAPFYLHIESFDVHEPFHVPEPYASMYGDASLADKYSVWPPYADQDFMNQWFSATPQEGIDYLRSQYAGKLTMVDRWLGEVMSAIDEAKLWDDTMIVVTTDHGHDLGEHRKLAKQYPHFDTHANIPLFVWHPQYPGEGRSISALTSTVDLFATVLDALSVKIPEVTHSKSMLPLISGERTDHREALLYGTFGQGVCVTDGEWTAFKSPEGDGALYSYSALIYRTLEPFYFEWLKLMNRSVSSLAEPEGQGHFIPGASLPQWKIPIKMRPLSRENFLFNRRDDPGQERNLWNDEAGQQKRLLETMVELIRLEGAPPEQYERLGLA
jgi:arylsulfatase A-like enzyme